MQTNTRHLPATAPVSSSILHGRIRLPAPLQAFQGHTSQAGFQLILPGKNSILSGSQHPRSPYKIPQVHSYRILQGEIGFIPKGSSIVYPYNTKVSVFQVTYSCAENNSTRILILPRVLAILCKDTVYYLQSKLS